MTSVGENSLQELLGWCESVIGPLKMDADHSREHPGDRTTTYRLRAASGYYYAKTHREQAGWENEVHGYEQWAPAFGNQAPRLLAVRLAVRDVEPLALLISELPGTIMEETDLPAEQAREAWRAAGRALAALHEHASGAFFGPCRRDGTPAGTPVYDAVQYMSDALDDWVRRGVHTGCLSADELAIAQAARGLIPAFAGERPVPCHRDYCPANWLVTAGGEWAGVIDFEFAWWDVRAVDFTRFPSWDWIERPDLQDALLEGYGRSFTPAEEQQRLFAHVLYSLGAVVWGEENAYYIYGAEGRRALSRLGRYF